MELIEACKIHLSEVLGLQMEAKPWKGAMKLPNFLGRTYDFYLISILGTPYVVAIAKEKISPAIVEKHLKMVREQGVGCIYVCGTISSYHRRRLIERRIPFVVPGNQVYLPDLGIDLREHFHENYTSSKPLSPSTQLVILYALLHPQKKKYIPSELASELGCSAMTMTRAFKELKARELAVVEERGRECWLNFKKTGQALWEEAKPLLRDPVKKRVWVQKSGVRDIGTRSGLSALSDASMLAEPHIPVNAMGAKDWKRLSQTKTILEIPSADEANLELEIWMYSPNLFAKGGLVDPFSLYLSLRGMRDERVEAALDQLMEKITW